MAEQASSTKEPKEVPGSVFFDSELLFVPKFEEAGIPQRIGMLGWLEPAVSVGQWIDRGDTLLTARYPVYWRQRKLKLPFFPDKTWSIDLTLSSPVAGFVLDLRQEKVSSRWYDSTLYSEERVLPVILLPRDEPPQDSWRLHFWRDIAKNFRAYWRQVRCCPARGQHVRLGEMISEEKEISPWAEAIRILQDLDEIRLSEFEVRKMTAQDSHLVTAVQGFRSKDLRLRDKLVHLTKLDQSK